MMAKLNYISSECQDPTKKKMKADEQKNWDDFTKLRKKVAIDLRKVREQIQERNELMGKNDMGNAVTVRMGRDIRNGLKDVMKETDELEAMQKKQEEKLEDRKLRHKEIKPEEEEEIERKKEIVDLCRQHIEECKRLEKQVRGNTGYSFSESTKNQDVIITSLPDIDGDEGFQLLRLQDQEIDEKLEQVSRGVKDLETMAKEMGKEIDMQGMMIGEVESKVEIANEKLANLNKRLKKTLAAYRKPSRFCIDIILLVVLLAIGGYLYNTFSKF